MKKIFYTALTVVLVAISSAPANAFELNVFEKSFDFNNDGKIDGFDWVKMSSLQKQELINSYHSSVFKNMTISTQTRVRGVNKVIGMLNYYYNGINQENQKIDVWYTYELIVD